MKETKLKNAMRFYLLATQLKYKIRSGWDEKHWNVSKERVESIAEHVYGTCILAISLDSEFQYYIGTLNLSLLLKCMYHIHAPQCFLSALCSRSSAFHPNRF